jgi:hypothetical protein
VWDLADLDAPAESLIAARSAVAADVWLDASGYDAGEFQPITVDAAWQAGCTGTDPQEWTSDPADFYVNVAGALDSAGLSIGALSGDRETMGVCWRGDLIGEAAIP